MKKIKIDIDTKKSFLSPLKLGYHHTYPENTKELIANLRPKVLRTFFEADDIKRAVDLGAEPYVDVKSYGFLSRPGDVKYKGRNQDKTNPPESWDAWKEYVKDKIKVLQQTNIKPKYYEIWNEPDRIKPPIFWKGTMEEYFMLYKFAFLAIREMDKEALIGGPEICYFDEKWIKGLIDFCIKEKLELNFLSFHNFKSGKDLVNNVKIARKLIKKYANKLKFKEEINIGEWGFRIEDSSEAFKHIYYAEKAGVNFYCKDFFYNAYESGSLLTKNFMPKPIYFAFLEYANLGKNRVEVTDNKNTVSFASNSNKLKILTALTGETVEEFNLTFDIKNKNISRASVKKLGNSGFKETKFNLKAGKIILNAKGKDVILISEKEATFKSPQN